MSVDVSNENEGREMFESLLNQVKIHHNYREREREWAYFGRCTDKFGINCMVNYYTYTLYRLVSLNLCHQTQNTDFFF